MGAQIISGREVIIAFERQFALLHFRSCSIVRETPVSVLYLSRRSKTQPLAASAGEHLLRCAGAIEQTFGGITANLWDDPFEWTLPENLNTTERVIEYLEEVEATRQRGFARFTEDRELLQEVLVPSGKTRPIIDLLTETLAKAAEYQGRATATLANISFTGDR